MPLSMANAGEEKYIKKIGGRTETKQFLESLGFTVGTMVKVIAVHGGNLIVQVRETRIAVSREMANKIIV
jgi:ferrous iron transport protein A